MLPDDQLERQLSAAGDRARSSADTHPDRGFAQSLRADLLADYPVPVAAAPRRGFVWPRFLRVAPLALAAVLAVATVVGAQQLWVAMEPDATPMPTVVPTVVPSVSAEATPSSTAAPIVDPEPTPDATPPVTPEPTVEPTAKPTPEPTAVPTPQPEPTPKPIGSMSLAALGCNGGVVLDWSVFSDERFNHYTTLRNTVAVVPKAYPPQEGAVDFGTSYTTHPEKTVAVDVSGSAGVTYYYRAMAFDGEDRVIAASPIRAATPKPVKGLGSLTVGAVAEGTEISWNPYGGLSGCFSYYKIVYSETHDAPTYGEDPHLAALSGQSESSWVDSTYLEPGKTYYLRVQAIRATELGWFVAAQSSVTTYVVP